MAVIGKELLPRDDCSTVFAAFIFFFYLTSVTHQKTWNGGVFDDSGHNFLHFFINIQVLTRSAPARHF